MTELILAIQAIFSPFLFVRLGVLVFHMPEIDNQMAGKIKVHAKNALYNLRWELYLKLNNQNNTNTNKWNK